MVAPPQGGSASSTAKPSPAVSGGSTAPPRNKSSTLNSNGYLAGPGNASAPLSSRVAQPLDMNSVERRGHPSTSRETPKRMRVHNLEEAPTYRPSEEQFKDPLKFIQSIAEEGAKYGIVKIIPPDGWNPEFAIDTERFHFRTRRQELNSVEGSNRSNMNYLDQLALFHRSNGTHLTRFPSVDKRPLDLYKLRQAVEERGGFEKVCKLKKWAEIGRDLGYSGKIMSSLSTSLKNSYQRWLAPYEDYCKTHKAGVQTMSQYDSSLSPPSMPPSKKKKVKSQNGFDSDSPIAKASNELHSAVNGIKTETPKPIISSGFTPVNSGFTAVNSPLAASTPKSNGVHTARDSTPNHPVDSPHSSAKQTPEYKASAHVGSVPTNGTSSHLKRQYSHDSPGVSSGKENGDNERESEEGNERWSKRLRREPAPKVTGSHMSLFRPSTPKMLQEVTNVKPGERCEACKSTENLTSILICDRCDGAYHTKCLDPPPQMSSTNTWHCPPCLVGTGEFGFEDGGVYSLRSFQIKAHNFKENHFLPKMPFDPVLNCKRPVMEDDVEREFWRLVESLKETVEVEYGADIHSTTHGSGFPTIEKNRLNPYAADPWNLNILPFHSDSLFRHIKSDISGMTVPWLYVGMCFSTFCWHNEDHYTYSANYQHFGATKTWYGVPGEDAEKFEAAMREAVPELFEKQPDLLFQLVTLLPPERLRKAGVRVYALDQRAGQFVITFPQAYHAGFNHGFNFNEAVNFAPPDWEQFGQAGVERLQEFKRQPCFSHDELLVTAASQETKDISIKTARWLAPALEKMRDRELLHRQDFAARHKAINPHQICRISDQESTSTERCRIVYEVNTEDANDDEHQCTFCKAYCYLSRYKCLKSNQIFCLLHAGTYQCCEVSEEERYISENHSLIYRLTKPDLELLAQRVVDRARAPDVWNEKYNKILNDEPKPSLKIMKSLLHEGERIRFDLPDLVSLKEYVERCSEWVDEATNYIVRKQQNRRKNEKVWRKSNATKAAEIEKREREHRNIDNIQKLLDEAKQLSFDCPEIGQLQERADAIAEFRRDAKDALEMPSKSSVQEIEELIELGRGFSVDIPEVDHLEKIVQQMKWDDRALAKNGNPLTLSETSDLIQEASELGISETHQPLVKLKEQKTQGELWESKAKELMAVESVHYQQLEALATQASTLPVSRETFAAVDQILTKQREAHKQILSMFEKSRDPDFRRRPKYKDVKELMDTLTELNSKPTGTIDLEKEQKRHEDWMRKGKKLFGKANAPLHILGAHMAYVESHNSDCFNLADRPRMPVEPSSRSQTPEQENGAFDEPGRTREIFCICRAPESGMMIECELCHEWYHCRCLKIARGKVKEDEKYKCPICDWRVRIPRDAARPKLEDLQDWQSEIPSLPFQPDEESCLSSIVDKAQEFRDFIRPYINPVMVTSEEVNTQRFYLRKIEGAEILLAWESNFFRQELHRLAPVAPEPPPVLEHSLSTRKPRPTKQQKLMAQMGISNPEDLPPQFRNKPPGPTKRKSQEPTTKRTPGPISTSHGRSSSPRSQSRTTPGTGTSATAPQYPSDQGQPAFAFESHYSVGSPPPTSARLGENAFLPSQIGSPGLETSLFTAPAFDHPNDTLSRSPSPEVDFDQGQSGNLDVFGELTNDGDAPDPEALSNEHANDILATLGSSSEKGDDAMDLDI